MSKSSRRKSIIVFTDGSCSRNGAKNAVGGIGVHFPNKELKDLSRIFHSGICTNQRTELYAILTAIRQVKKYLGLSNYKIYIKTDSQYSIDCITKWAFGWVKNGWITKEGKPVANKEFIELLHKYYERYDIEFEHVEGHSDGIDRNSRGNRAADKLATAATAKAQQDKRGDSSGGKYSGRTYGDKNQGRQRGGSKSSRTTNARYDSSRKISAKNVRKQGFPKSTDFVVELVKTTKN